MNNCENLHCNFVGTSKNISKNWSKNMNNYENIYTRNYKFLWISKDNNLCIQNWVVVNWFVYLMPIIDYVCMQIYKA